MPPFTFIFSIISSFLFVIIIFLSFFILLDISSLFCWGGGRTRSLLFLRHSILMSFSSIPILFRVAGSFFVFFFPLFFFCLVFVYSFSFLSLVCSFFFFSSSSLASKLHSWLLIPHLTSYPLPSNVQIPFFFSSFCASPSNFIISFFLLFFVRSFCYSSCFIFSLFFFSYFPSLFFTSVYWQRFLILFYLLVIFSPCFLRSLRLSQFVTLFSPNRNASAVGTGLGSGHRHHSRPVIEIGLLLFQSLFLLDKSFYCRHRSIP